MAESNPEIKSDEYTIRHRDIGCDGEQRSLIPKQQASEEQRNKVSGQRESVKPQVIFQLKLFACLYIICSTVTFFILVILFMQGRLHFYLNNANCAVECIELDNIVKDRDACNEKLDSYQTYLDFIGSIDHRIQNMDTCNSYLKLYCDCLKDEDPRCTKRYLKYLNCEDALPKDYHDKIKASYSRLLDDVIMVKKNLTDLLITGNFEMMREIYEQQKNLPMDNCHFICSLDVENFDTKHNATYWKAFEDGWKMFSKYFLS